MLRVLDSQEGDAPENAAGMLCARVLPSPACPFQPRATIKRVGEDPACAHRARAPWEGRAGQRWRGWPACPCHRAAAGGTPPAPLADSQGCIRKAKLV